MQASGLARLRDISYVAARRLVLAVGLGVLLLTAGVMYARRVDTVEVAGTLLFMFVFVAFVFGKIRGGIVAGILAALGYAALRYPAIQAVGIDRFVGLIVSRAVAYVTFGAIGGWAIQSLEGSLTKLELYDQIDDETGLYNARFFVEDTDLEMSRSRRYRTIFSVVVADIPAGVLESLTLRQRRGILRHLGRVIRDSVRTVDRPVHSADERGHRLAVVLPETGRDGARIFIDRFADRIAGYLNQRGAVVSSDSIGRLAVSFPDDEGAVQSLRAEFAAIDRVEHPEAAEIGPDAPRP
jgi:GGDEF domain-containing protein